jgi:2-iminobutanoate/2-iminopropanoate deaminase
MKRENTRRKFLAVTTKGTGVAAAALAVGATARGASKEGKLTKKVITLPGRKVTSATPYSPAIQFGNLIFVSGHIAIDPATQKLVAGTGQDQVRQCLENLKAVVEASGSSMDKVLKCTVFLADIADFSAMNEVYRTFFPSDPPARSTVAVKLGPGASVEIDCFAYTV